MKPDMNILVLNNLAGLATSNDCLNKAATIMARHLSIESHITLKHKSLGITTRRDFVIVQTNTRKLLADTRTGSLYNVGGYCVSSIQNSVIVPKAIRDKLI